MEFKTQVAVILILVCAGGVTMSNSYMIYGGMLPTNLEDLKAYYVDRPGQDRRRTQQLLQYRYVGRCYTCSK